MKSLRWMKASLSESEKGSRVDGGFIGGGLGRPMGGEGLRDDSRDGLTWMDSQARRKRSRFLLQDTRPSG